jgi:hypothetical protein
MTCVWLLRGFEHRCHDGPHGPQRATDDEGRDGIPEGDSHRDQVARKTEIRQDHARGGTPALWLVSALLPHHHPPEQVVGEVENPDIASVNSRHNRGRWRCQISSKQCCREGNQRNDEQEHPIEKEEPSSRVFRPSSRR